MQTGPEKIAFWAANVVFKRIIDAYTTKYGLLDAVVIDSNESKRGKDIGLKVVSPNDIVKGCISIAELNSLIICSGIRKDSIIESKKKIMDITNINIYCIDENYNMETVCEGDKI